MSEHDHPNARPPAAPPPEVPPGLAAPIAPARRSGWRDSTRSRCAGRRRRGRRGPTRPLGQSRSTAALGERADLLRTARSSRRGPRHRRRGLPSGALHRRPRRLDGQARIRRAHIFREQGQARARPERPAHQPHHRLHRRVARPRGRRRRARGVHAVRPGSHRGGRETLVKALGVRGVGHSPTYEGLRSRRGLMRANRTDGLQLRSSPGMGDSTVAGVRARGAAGSRPGPPRSSPIDASPPTRERSAPALLLLLARDVVRARTRPPTTTEAPGRSSPRPPTPARVDARRGRRVAHGRGTPARPEVAATTRRTTRGGLWGKISQPRTNAAAGRRDAIRRVDADSCDDRTTSRPRRASPASPESSRACRATTSSPPGRSRGASRASSVRRRGLMRGRR